MFIQRILYKGMLFSTMLFQLPICFACVFPLYLPSWHFLVDECLPVLLPSSPLTIREPQCYFVVQYIFIHQSSITVYFTVYRNIVFLCQSTMFLTPQHKLSCVKTVSMRPASKFPSNLQFNTLFKSDTTSVNQLLYSRKPITTFSSESTTHTGGYRCNCWEAIPCDPVRK